MADYAKAAIIGTLVGAAAGTGADYLSKLVIPKVDAIVDPIDNKYPTKLLSGVVDAGLNVGVKLTISSGMLYVGDMALDRVLDVDPTQGLYFSFGFMASQFSLLSDVQKFFNALKAQFKPGN